MITVKVCESDKSLFHEMHVRLWKRGVRFSHEVTDVAEDLEQTIIIYEYNDENAIEAELSQFFDVTIG